MFDKYIAVNDNQAVRDAAAVVARAAKEHDKTLKSISEKEIKSKDRVDISLEEYERLKEENEYLRRENHVLKLTLGNIGIPPEIMDRIIPDSVRREYCKDLRDFVTHYRVYFSVEECSLR